MKVFVPMPDECTDIEALRQMVLVPYRCGLPLLPADIAVERVNTPSTGANPPERAADDLSAAA